MLHLFVTDKHKTFDFSRAIFFNNLLIGRVVVGDVVELLLCYEREYTHIVVCDALILAQLRCDTFAQTLLWSIRTRFDFFPSVEIPFEWNAVHNCSNNCSNKGLFTDTRFESKDTSRSRD